MCSHIDLRSQKAFYKMIHFIFIFVFLPSLSCFEAANDSPIFRNTRITLANVCSTFSAIFAEVSINSQLNCQASIMPSSFDTSRSLTLSHLFPTTMRIGSAPFTHLIDWWKNSIWSKVDRDAIEYTNMSLWPYL